MRRLILFLGLYAGLLLVPGLAWAADDEAENHLVDAVIAYRAEDWDAAFSALQAARATAGSDEMRARIERQAALLLAATDRPVDALQKFREAIALDPEIDLETWRFGPGVTTLFACARKMPANAPRPERLQSDGERGWLCPVDATSPEAEVEVPSTPPAPPEGAPPPDLKTTTPSGKTPVEGPGIEIGRPSGPSALGPLGGVGIGLIVAGLGVGGGIAAWQFVERQDALDTVDSFESQISNNQGGPNVTASRNQAEEDRASAENNMILAISLGSGVVATGLVLLIVDLVNGPDEDVDLGAAEALTIGPNSAGLRFRF